MASTEGLDESNANNKQSIDYSTSVGSSSGHGIGCRPKATKFESQTKDHTLCAVCVEIGLEHTTHTYCFDCGRTMCEMCNLNHQQISAFREHVRIDMVEEGSTLEEKLSSLICKEHDNMIQKYCWDCSRPVCSVCLIFEHKDHTIKVFSYKIAEDDENYEQLQKKFTDLQAKLQMIQSIKARHAQHQREIQQQISSQKENFANQLSAQDQQFTERLNADHREKQRNLQQVQQKVERAKKVVDVLMQRAGVVHQKQAELAKLQALREEVLQLEATDKDQGHTEENQDLMDMLMEQAEVVKQKQAELVRLKDLREQLRQLEISTNTISQGLAPGQKDESSQQEPDLAASLPEDVDIPNFTDPKVMMAIIQAIGNQIPKFKEETKKNEMHTTFSPGELDFDLASLQLPDEAKLSQLHCVQDDLKDMKQLAARITEENAQEEKERNDTN